MFFVPHFGHAKVYETSIWTPCFQISAKTLPVPHGAMIMGQLDTPGFTLFTVISEAVSQARLEVVVCGDLVQDVGQAALGVAEVLGVEVDDAGGD